MYRYIAPLILMISISPVRSSPEQLTLTQRTKEMKAGIVRDSQGNVKAMAPRGRKEYQKHLLMSKRHFQERTQNLDWKRLKPDLLLPSVAEFSGVIQWAHKKGITGKGVRVGDIETNEKPFIVSPETEYKFRSADSRDKGASFMEAHALGVTNVISQIAPNSQIVVSKPSDEDKEVEEILPFLRDAVAVNVSYQELEKESEVFRDFFHKVLKEGIPKLLIRSASNESMNISNPAFGSPSGINSNIDYVNDSEIHPYLILVGALTASMSPAPFSNFPGKNEKVQNCFIWTLGDDVLTLTKDKTVQKVSGTSYATPVVTGVVALLKQAFPKLEAPDIREIILESADRNFVRESTRSFRRKRYEDEYVRQDVKYAEYVFDSADGLPLPAITQKPEDMAWDEWFKIIYEDKELQKRIVAAVPFDPAYYGKGILNIRNAFIYARLKTEHKGWDKKQLRQEMLRVVHDEDSAAATTIQRKWRARHAARA